MASGDGPYLTDVDGNTYVDLVCSWGPMILGHRHPRVVGAVRTAIERGTSFGTPTPAEVKLAELIVQRVGPPVQKVRLVTSGTEATMTAIRLARAHTRRRIIVKFEGCYHGHVDSLLRRAGSGPTTLNLEDPSAVSGAESAQTLVLPYNDIDTVSEVLSLYGNQVACIITEAAPANMGVVAPALGFNQALRSLCNRYGCLLILDEVLTGFRVSPSGWFGLEHVPADLFTFGKVMGGGLPVAAVGGRDEIMSRLAPSGDVYQAGTLAGNPIAVAAGLATLRSCTDEVYETVNRRAAETADLISESLRHEGVPHIVSRAGSLFSVFFTNITTVNDYKQAKAQSTERYAAFFHAMLDHGVYLPPSGFESWFLSSAHDDLALERIAAAARPAARVAATTNVRT
jgi:glutamate-1-semialdehyde 2,1-aminomutase